MNGDDMWDAAMRIAERVSEVLAMKREAKRKRRNERAKLRRAINKKLGIKPKKKPEPEPERPYEPPEGCECHFPNAAIPCRWCERSFECDKCGEILGKDDLAEGSESTCYLCAEDAKP